MLVLHDNGEPPSFDAHKTWGYRTFMPMSLVYPRLLKWEHGPNVGPHDDPNVPDLAAAMPEQPDTTTYIFKLRPARWENKPPLNARELTAEDVVKNWEKFVLSHRRWGKFGGWALVGAFGCHRSESSGDLCTGQQQGRFNPGQGLESPNGAGTQLQPADSLPCTVIGRRHPWLEPPQPVSRPALR